jgi:hypothetical protein
MQFRTFGYSLCVLGFIGRSTPFLMYLASQSCNATMSGYTFAAVWGGVAGGSAQDRRGGFLVECCSSTRPLQLVHNSSLVGPVLDCPTARCQPFHSEQPAVSLLLGVARCSSPSARHIRQPERISTFALSSPFHLPPIIMSSSVASTPTPAALLARGAYLSAWRPAANHVPG